MADEAGTSPPAERSPQPEPPVVTPVQAPGEEAGSGADLLTIALLVFFVALLLIVAALLTLPVIFG